MNKWMLGGIAYLVGIPLFAIMLLQAPSELTGQLPLPTIQQAEASWDQQAEQALGLKPGQGQYLTEAEWAAHQRTLWTMVPEAQARYRQDVQGQVAERERSRTAASSARG
jgi:hypothetical protein